MTVMGTLPNRSLDAAGASPDRRREQRWPCDVAAAVMPLSSQQGFVEAMIVDFSDHGLSVSLANPLRVGEQFVVKAQLDQVGMLIYAVRNCVLDAGRYRVGAEFAGAVATPQNESDDALRAQFVMQLAIDAARESRD